MEHLKYFENINFDDWDYPEYSKIRVGDTVEVIDNTINWGDDYMLLKSKVDTVISDKSMIVQIGRHKYYAVLKDGKWFVDNKLLTEEEIINTYKAEYGYDMSLKNRMHFAEEMEKITPFSKYYIAHMLKDNL